MSSLDRKLIDDARRQTEEAARERGPLPENIGGYHVLGLLGRGGMGIVYLAHQNNPDRLVALKVMRGIAPSRERHRRFLDEARILGRLEHRGIARIYEAGIARSEGGVVPFFAMERIEGRPLTDHASAEALSTRARLQLIMHICHAVQYAHNKGVVHRDLKPANILVTADGQPKILDFGVARITDSDVHATTHTEVGQLIGTLPFMSPEQARGDSASVDNRTDVYALGVLTYRLLSGRNPFELNLKNLQDAIGTICDEVPRSVSTWDRSLRGDIDAIVHRALAKEPERRYQSASDLASDIERFLNNEPISARPPTALYHLGKFARRHTTMVAVIVLGALGLLATIAGTSYGFFRANQARAEAESVTAFLERTIAAIDPKEGGGNILLRDVLEPASRELDDGFQNNPRVRARLDLVVGTAYRELGDFDIAEHHLQRACETRERIFGRDTLPTARAVHEMAVLEVYRGDMPKGEQLIRRALAVFADAAGPSDPHTLELENDLGVVLQKQGHYQEAMEYYEQALRKRRALEIEDDPEVLTLLGNMAFILHRSMSKFDAAEPLYLEVHDTRAQSLGVDHPLTALAAQNLAIMYMDMQRYSEAEPLLEECHRTRLEAYGPDHTETLMALGSIARLRKEQRQFDEAQELYRRVVDGLSTALGPSHQGTLVLMNNLARCYTVTQDYELAEPLFRHVLETRRSYLGATHLDTLSAANNFAGALAAQERYEEAERILAGFPEMAMEHYPDFAGTPAAMVRYALILEQTRTVEAARAYIDQALPLILKDQVIPRRRAGIAKTMDFYERNGFDEQAELCRTHLARTEPD